MSKRQFYIKALLTTCLLSSHFIEAIPATRSINSTSNDPTIVGTLPYWILNANSGDTIDLSPISGQTITLTTSLPAISKDYTINGSQVTIDGANSYQAFQVATGTSSINNLHIQNAISKGGDGGSGYSGGGGSVGGGGALYVHSDTTVTLSASSLVNNKAQGGNGGLANNNGNAGGGGGGGFGGGNGGNCMTIVSTGGGGGGHSNGGNGGTEVSKDGSNGVYFGGGGGGAGINSVVPGGIGGNANFSGTFIGGAESSGNGGGGAGSSQDGFSASGSGSSGIPGNGGNGIGVDLMFGGGGGGGSSSETGFAGAIGVGAAGGGGGSNYAGGLGGILGGGGGGGLGAPGGEGGFGAGGGGAVIGGIGGGGFNAGGGNGGSDPSANGAGGGGSALGGAIFVQNGGNLVIVDAEQISGNIAIAGIGGSSTSTDPSYVPAGNGAAIGQDIFMRETSSITFDLTNTLTLATPIEGDQTNGPNSNGGLLKRGQGTLHLNGSNTYSGLTTIESGNLNLNGSVIGSIMVDTDGKLSGNATAYGDLTNAGILSPGNSIGTINTTNLILLPASRLEMEIAADGTSDLIAATDTAQINGALKVIPLTGNYETSQAYTVITAENGVTGAFTAVTTTEPTLLEIIYNPNSVVLEAFSLSSMGLDSNAEKAAFCYLSDGFSIGSDKEIVNAALLTLNADEINKSFNQMQPSQFSALAWAQIENALLVRSSYSDHLKDRSISCDCSNRPYLWAEAIGGWQRQKSSGQQFGYSDWTAGGTVGLDACSSDNLRCGIAGSYTHTRLNWDKSAGHANINSYYGGLYSNWTDGCMYINAALLGSYSHYHTDRHLHFATIKRDAKSSLNSWQGLAGLEAGFEYACSECVNILPFVRLDTVYLSRECFKEKGADSLDLHVNKKRDTILQSELGIYLAGRYIYENSCNPGTFVPHLKLSYINDTSFNNRHLKANFIDSECDFKARGLNFNRNLGAVSVGLTYLNCNETTSLKLLYDGQFGVKYYNQSGKIALDVRF